MYHRRINKAQTKLDSFNQISTRYICGVSCPIEIQDLMVTKHSIMTSYLRFKSSNQNTGYIGIFLSISTQLILVGLDLNDVFLRIVVSLFLFLNGAIKITI